MYQFFLAVHNIMRWVIVVLAIVALVRAYRGWLGKREWSQSDRKSRNVLPFRWISAAGGLILFTSG
jgi:uncharacterized membrane protein YozB (DUF420 family)